MREQFPTPEINQSINREEIINAYKKFVEQGITNPDVLDNADSGVKEANELFYKWIAQEDARVQEENNNPEVGYSINLAKTMLYVDAGFTDPAYLNEVLSWLNQDAQDPEKQLNNPERIATRQQIAEAIKKVRSLLANPAK